MKKSFLLAIVFMLLLLAGCGTPDTSPTPTPTSQHPTSTPTPTSTPLPPTPTPIVGPTFIDKVDPQDIRLLDYNINWDAIFPDDDPNNHGWREVDMSAQFRRVIAAISPDIACIQEVNSYRDPSDVSDIFNEVLPLEGGGQWNAISVRDAVIVSRFPLATEGYEIYFPNIILDLTQAAALIDLPDATYGTTDFYLICSHFKASGGVGDIRKRQNQADVVIRQVADFKTPGDYIDLPADTPFVFAGDFNVYDTDPAAHLETLITGDIFYNDRYVPDIEPDWDDTWLTDALPSINGEGEEFYTWRNDDDIYNAGPLDRVIYSDSVMTVTHEYVLNTTELSQGMLDLYGLQANDVVMVPEVGNYDHLPLVVDFTFGGN